MAGDIAIDTQPPTVRIESDKSLMRGGEAATLTFTLSEESTGFDVDDIRAGGVISNFTGSGRIYTATLTPSPLLTTRYGMRVSVEAGKFHDLAGNANFLGSTTLVVDAEPPQVTITADRLGLRPGSSAMLTFKLSEPSKDFTASDVTIAPGMGTLSPLVLQTSDKSGLTYRATFTAARHLTDITTTVVSVAQDAFTDDVGNGNVAGSSLPLTIDAIPPTITITTNTAALRFGQTATIKFTLSKASTTFDVAKVTVANGTLSNFRGEGRSYSATFTPRRSFTGTGTVAVASGVFWDWVGNTNLTGATLQVLLAP